jgi:hypothetical protein
LDWRNKKTATNLENILVSARKPITSYNASFEKELPGLRNMRTFGEIAIVNDHAKRKMRGKLGDRGRPCILLGRAENHHRDVYRFLNLETERIIQSRDALWLNKQYGVWKGITKQNVTNIGDDDDDDNDNEPFLDLSREESPNIETGRETESLNIKIGRETADVNQIEVVDTNDNPVPPKLASAMRKLGGLFDQEPQTITDRVRATRQLATKPTEDPITQSGREDTINVLIDGFDEDLKSIPYFAFLVAGVEKNLSPEQKKTGSMNEAYDKLSASEYKHVFDVPGKFREKWDYPDPWQKETWWTGNRAEFARMNKKAKNET